ncbi:MAG TPA: Asp-tRNA(Asn)/Glu-tRNA(Gln) amidotransferase subunit GatA [Candidatus Sumerlaeota bacterium]|nr:MAG: Glutamyl-tRNA(Gln) amidotransferase subunit A [candidate division BRC1 bacterium ADurb.BinA292]HOE96768.1 Asp-tRNA(Asn)/Glu-tRNA(Gln) amidotransferase subunit GatA [Candidatus Sumerlaeota bacterium]HOR28655.1 Asp-tRNA(Asn)/Glu-tRNA(Gln) amidotransferase subunit GatA [Candidatus Sumerlaeota bacterium]HPK03690.1 Asp-tRNA(Asn)/Glu-tRNA(Gln) amidotransferase subunit GatA [Candidatus Sumerlaeota bacterium]
MTDAPAYATLKELQRSLEAGECSSRELTQALLDRIEALDGKLGAFLRVTPDEALQQADAADAARRQGRRSPLLGIPLGLKDILCTRGVATTCASRILRDFIPPYDATAVARLRQAGAVFLGKLNMDEFAMGSSCEFSAWQPTRNPWDPTRIPGGSSGGSAAAVAAGFCPATLGTDTGGSIRQPAALCGVVGLKPTYGRVSRYGLIAFASSLDQIGPFARTVEDCALLLNAIAAQDPLDSTSAPVATSDYTECLGREIRGLRVGLPREYFIDGMEPAVEAAVRRAVADLAAQGAEIVEISLPHTEYAVAVYYICATAEASSNLARYDGAHYGYRAAGTRNIIEMYSRSRTEGFGEEVKRRIMLGTYVLSAGFYDAYYSKALKVRTLITRDFAEAFRQVDVIATPTTPGVAFRIGEKLDDPLQMYLSDIFTISANLAGIPGLSLPCGFTAEGLPIGLQLLAPAFEEARLLQVAHAYEQSHDWWRRRPELA